MDINSFYSGYGGMDAGFLQAGGCVGFAAENNPHTTRAYRTNFPHTAEVVEDDIANIEDIPSDRLWIGGPPCQGFSQNGKQDPSDSRSQELMRLARLIAKHKPPAAAIENVAALATGQSKKLFLDPALSLLQETGYRTTIFNLNARHWIPQNRKRIFIVAIADGFPLIPEIPESPQHNWTVRDAIAELGDCPYARQICEYNGGEITGHKAPHHPQHQLDTIERFKRLKQGQKDPISRRVRLSWGGVAPTLTAGHSGNGKYSAGTPLMPVHPQFPRALSVREAARLQGFPDSYIFPGSKLQSYRGVGNSVPPPLAKAVALSVFDAIDPDIEVRVVTLKQPWAWAIAYLGKDIENRTFGTSYRGLLAIHAGQSYDEEGAEWIHRTFGICPPPRAELRKRGEMGAIVASVQLKGVGQSDSIWALEGYCHWQLGVIKRLPPYPFKGQQAAPFRAKIPRRALFENTVTVLSTSTREKAIQEYRISQQEEMRWTA